MKKIVILCCMGLFVACSGAASQDPIGNPPITMQPNSPDASVVVEAGVDSSAAVDAGIDSSIACVPENDATFCSRYNSSCGSVIGFDNCDTARTVTICGGCKDTEFCNNGMCSNIPCVPATDASLCTTANKDCGVASIVDNCGTIRNAVCGQSDCGKGFLCTANKCTACVPKVCAANSCGQMSDGCNPAPLDCGTCSGTDMCVNNICKPCVPKTCLGEGFNCGSIANGCGKVENCGACVASPAPNQSVCTNVLGGTCKTYAELCVAPVMPKTFIGSCIYYGYSIDLVNCIASNTGAAVDDYVDNFTVVPDFGHKNTCLTFDNAVNGIHTYNCVGGKLLTVTTSIWSDVQASHTPSVGGCQSNGVAISGAIVDCTETTHWFGAPNTTAQIKASCLLPQIYLPNP